MRKAVNHQSFPLPEINRISPLCMIVIAAGFLYSDQKITVSDRSLEL